MKVIRLAEYNKLNGSKDKHYNIKTLVIFNTNNSFSIELIINEQVNKEYYKEVGYLIKLVNDNKEYTRHKLSTFGITVCSGSVLLAEIKYMPIRDEYVIVNSRYFPSQVLGYCKDLLLKIIQKNTGQEYGIELADI